MRNTDGEDYTGILIKHCFHCLFFGELSLSPSLLPFFFFIPFSDRPLLASAPPLKGLPHLLRSFFPPTLQPNMLAFFRLSICVSHLMILL